MLYVVFIFCVLKTYLNKLQHSYVEISLTVVFVRRRLADSLQRLRAESPPAAAHYR